MSRFLPVLAALSIALVAVVVAGCVRDNAEMTAVDTSGAWNRTDSAVLAERLLGDLLAEAWHADFADRNGRPPVVAIGHFTVRTSLEPIDTRRWRDDLLAAGQADGRLAMGLVEEVDSPDFTLTGRIVASREVAGRQERRHYSVTLVLSRAGVEAPLWERARRLVKVVTRD